MANPVTKLLQELNNLKQVTALPLAYSPCTCSLCKKYYFEIFADSKMDPQTNLCTINCQELPEASCCYDGCAEDFCVACCKHSCNCLEAMCCNMGCQCLLSMVHFYLKYKQCIKYACKCIKNCCSSEHKFSKPPLPYSIEIEQHHLENDTNHTQIYIPQMFDINTGNSKEKSSILIKSGLGVPSDIYGNLIIDGEQQGYIQKFEKFPVNIDQIYTIKDKKGCCFQLFLKAYQKSFEKLKLDTDYNIIYIGGAMTGYIVHGMQKHMCCEISFFKRAHHILFNRENQIVCRIYESKENHFELYDAHKTKLIGSITPDRTAGCCHCLLSLCCLETYCKICLPIITFTINFQQINNPLDKLMILQSLPYLAKFRYRHAIFKCNTQPMFNELCTCCLRSQHLPQINNKINYHSTYDQDEIYFIQDQKQLKGNDILYDLQNYPKTSLEGKTIESIIKANIQDLDKEQLSQYSTIITKKSFLNDMNLSQMTSQERPFISNVAHLEIN